jgi:hypothetical protein
MSDNRHDWLTELAALSPRIASLNSTSILPQLTYGTPAAPANLAAYNLSASRAHNAAIARWFECLPQSATPQQIRKLLGDLTSDRNRTTYGTFSELAAYGALANAELKFDIQVPMAGREILNPNGSDLDGLLHLNNDVLFDVKGFGLQEYLVEALLERLNADFAPECIRAEGSWDVSVATLDELLGSAGYRALKAELNAGSRATARRQTLEFVRGPAQQVQISIIAHDPYAAAAQHADYAFRFAKQFPRRRRFLLVFVFHPWLGGFNKHVNFASAADIFLRAFARRTFLQFRRDRTNRCFDVSRGAASRLISGLLFLDAWQDAEGPRHGRLFLNPNAKSPLSDLDRDILQHGAHWLAIDDFRHDVY